MVRHSPKTSAGYFNLTHTLIEPSSLIWVKSIYNRLADAFVHQHQYLGIDFFRFLGCEQRGQCFKSSYRFNSVHIHVRLPCYL